MRITAGLQILQSGFICLCDKYVKKLLTISAVIILCSKRF